ncbi:hypothetical protein DFS34DRAFT_597373 [Phlyctochytrium arcticum]|nr:hypothetical protein DFS34DRAFT_597373 [Phlyctochytrium arcticum]
MSLSQAQDVTGHEHHHHPGLHLQESSVDGGSFAVGSMEEECQRLIEQLQEYIPPEATALLFEAGYETLHAFRNLNLTDLADAEAYTKKSLKPGHKKLIMQYVANRPYDEDSDDMSARQLLYRLEASPLGKRRRLSEDSPSPGAPVSLLQLQAFLERHLMESPVTRHIRKDIDYSISVQHTPDRRGVEGIWKCLVCNSRPVTISLRNGGRQPQLSNVGTHLKTIKHTGAMKERKNKTLLQSDSITVALAAHLAQVRQQQQEEEQAKYQIISPSRLPQGHIPNQAPNPSHLTVTNASLLLPSHVAHGQDPSMTDRSTPQ